MGIQAISVSAYQSNSFTLLKRTATAPQDAPKEGQTAIRDILDIGKGDPIGTIQSMNIVVERAMDKLRAVVSDARNALGIPEDAQIDTSPEATASRIADFALGAFDKWLKQHPGLADDDARQQFASFIGGAIQQGISEARGILNGLNALNPEVDGSINKTWDVIQGRLNDFVANKK